MWIDSSLQKSYALTIYKVHHQNRVIKIVRSNQSKERSELPKSTYFEEKREPGFGLFFDSSRLLKGRQSIQNKLLFMRSLSHPWNTEKHSVMTYSELKWKRHIFLIFHCLFKFCQFLKLGLYRTLFQAWWSHQWFFPRLGQDALY